MELSIDSFSPERSMTLGEQVYQILRRQIVTGKAKPGEIIDEKELAASLNISRTPVREAVKRLSDENLIDVVSQSGTRVSQLVFREIEEAYLIRKALECESAAQAAARMSKAHEKALSEIMNMHFAELKDKNFNRALELDDQFHQYIASISNLQRLWQMVAISKGQLDRCRHLLLPVVGEARKTMEYHQYVFERLVSGDGEASRQAMGEHLDYAFSVAQKKLKGRDLSFPIEKKNRKKAAPKAR